MKIEQGGESGGERGRGIHGVIERGLDERGKERMG
jgi:hypothetical protein